MTFPAHLSTMLLSFGVTIAVVLLTVWWRQQTFRWPIVMAICVPAAILLGWWSGMVFQVPSYRAGCDGLCPGSGGAPVAFFAGEEAGGQIMPGMFVLNCLVYLTVLLAWGGALRGLLSAAGGPWQAAMTSLLLLVVMPALLPLLVPPPEAHVRGDPQRVAINAGREVYLYGRSAAAPILRVALEDVRPRRDGQPGLRVCLQAYTFFYVPIGHLYLDMTPEGVHSNAGGVVPQFSTQSCWN